MQSKKAGGLAGVIAGETAICTVGTEGVGLTYRGYGIHDWRSTLVLRRSHTYSFTVSCPRGRN